MSDTAYAWPLFCVVLPALVAAFVAAPRLSAALIRLRVRRLPGHVAERLLEEWLAEVDHTPTRGGKLAFAIRLLATRTRPLLDAIETSDAPAGLNGTVVLSIDERIAPPRGDFTMAGLIDFAILILLSGGAFRMADTALAALTWTTVAMVTWLVVVHVCVVRLCDATPGQLCTGIRVVAMDGSPLTWHHVMWRAVPLLVFPAGFVITFAVAWSFAGAPLTTVTKNDVAAMFSREPFRVVFAALQVWVMTQCFSRSPGTPDFNHAWSGTTLILKVPRVVGVLDESPHGSTSAMR